MAAGAVLLSQGQRGWGFLPAALEMKELNDISVLKIDGVWKSCPHVGLSAQTLLWLWPPPCSSALCRFLLTHSTSCFPIQVA